MSEWWESDYFRGYRGHLPHPMMTSTGSEGRCDICGRSSTRDHEPPYQRITEAEARAEKASSSRPITFSPPVHLFPWETQPSTGEGPAGRYLDHVRKTKETKTMKASMQITVEADTWATLFHALLDLSEYDGVSITKFDEVGAGAAVADQVRVARERFDSLVASPSKPITNRRLVVPGAIKAYLASASRLAGPVVVKLAYKSPLTGVVTVRNIRPIQIGTDRVHARDVDKDEHRTFLLRGIQWVEGPDL